MRVGRYYNPRNAIAPARTEIIAICKKNSLDHLTNQLVCFGAMSKTAAKAAPQENARTRLLNAALALIRQRGYSATTVDELCAAAGVTKGAFFHHFKSKEALGVAAAEYWSEMTGALFASAPYHEKKDPLERVLAYIDFRAQIIDGPLESFTCLVGTMVQETYGSSDAIRQACEASITGHALTLEADIEAAIARYGCPPDISARSLALHTQAVLQGGFILAKAEGGPQLARDSAAHLKRYFTLLFQQAEVPTTRNED